MFPLLSHSFFILFPACFTRMHMLERKAAATRLTTARTDMVAAESIEADLQAKYARFTRRVQDYKKEMNITVQQQ